MQNKSRFIFHFEREYLRYKISKLVKIEKKTNIFGYFNINLYLCTHILLISLMTFGIIKQLLVNSMHNPLYFNYHMRNATHYRFKKYFPTIYGYFKSKAIDLGNKSDLRRLHVILRTTDQVMNINASRNLEDIGIVTKNDVIRMGGCTLFKAAEHFAQTFGRENLRITLVIDRLSDAGMNQYREAAKVANLSFDAVEAKGSGSSPTFQTQVDLALQDSDDTLAFILEDDYWLDEQSLTTCFHIMQTNSKVIGMNPHFHPDRERRQDIGKLVTIDGHLYCRIFNTCCTFFMPVKEMKRYKKYLRVFECWEDGSINSIWKKCICIGPLGWTMAEALHRSELSPVNNFIKL